MREAAAVQERGARAQKRHYAFLYRVDIYICINTQRLGLHRSLGARVEKNFRIRRLSSLSIAEAYSRTGQRQAAELEKVQQQRLPSLSARFVLFIFARCGKHPSTNQSLIEFQSARIRTVCDESGAGMVRFSFIFSRPCRSIRTWLAQFKSNMAPGGRALLFDSHRFARLLYLVE